MSGRLSSAGDMSALSGLRLRKVSARTNNLVQMWRKGAKPNAAFVATYRSLSNSLGLLGWVAPVAQAGNRFAAHANRAKLPTGAR